MYVNICNICDKLCANIECAAVTDVDVKVNYN